MLEEVGGDDRRMTGLGGRRQRRTWRLIGALCGLAIVVSTLYAVWQLVHGGLQPTDTAGLLGLPLGVTGLVTTVVSLRKAIEGNDAELVRGLAATLARQIEADESRVWRQLLGDDIRRINLAYVLHPAAVRPAEAPAAGRLTAEGPSPATLPDIVTYYRSTRPLRMVVTGAAGAGKTVLALELLLALIKGRDEDDPVPVRIPLSRWDTERQSLAALLQRRLVEAYDWPVGLAARLVHHGLVLPVLDGLDEMDPPGTDGSPDPAAPRATAVVRALNAYQQGRDAGSLILTCRTQHYDALVPHTTVFDAARIAIAPVDTADARDYLTGRALAPAHWRPLTDHLAAHPGGPLATLLSTPWRLCLIATVYHQDGDPASLLTLSSPEALDRHLLARYIPAATRTAPNPRGYAPRDVHRWLHHLTTHLDPTSTPRGRATVEAESTDLVLHELWSLGGRTRVRAADAFLSTLAILTILPLAETASPEGRPILWPLIATCALVVGVAGFMTRSPRRLSNPFGPSDERRDFIAVALLGSGLGLGIGVVSKIGFGPAGTLVAEADLVVSAGLMFKIARGISREPSPGRRAQAVIRSEILLGLVLVVMAGTVVGLAFLLLFGSASGIVFLLVSGLVGGLTIALAFGATASRRYLVFLLCSRHRLPLRLVPFLDWAVTAGLLRCSGSAYQYRHRELQRWLRGHPDPAPLPARP